MAINRLAISNASANTDTVLYTSVRNCLTSVIATNKSNSQSLIRIWIVPAGQSGDSTKWMHIAYDSIVTGNNSLETFRFPLENGDLVYVRADSANISFSLSGIYENSGAQKVYYDSTAPGAPSIGDIWVNSGASYANTNTSAVIAYQAAEPTTKSPNLLWVDSSGNNTVYANQTGVTGNWTVNGDIQAYAVHSSANNDSLELFVGQTFNTYGDAAISLRGVNSGYNNGGMEIYTGGSESFRITSDRLIGAGTSTPTGRITATAAVNDVISNWTKAAFVGSGSYGGGYSLVDGSAGWNIRAQEAGAHLKFGYGTTTSSLTDFIHITNSGTFGIGGPSSGSMLYVLQPSTGNSPALYTRQQYASFAGIIHQNLADRANNSAYQFLSNYSSGGGDVEHYMRGDGQSYADGSWNGGGADYAEYFEWLDGNTTNEDRRGLSVVLINDKIKVAEEGELPIGVISGNPSVVGDDSPIKWTKKYLRDEYGSYIRNEDGDRVLNPDYNPEQEYVSREDRPEWAIVGLMGKLRLRKGQVVGVGWIKMKDISENVEEWLVK
jgi:hypothetical protein